jgi:WD repeat-containing protein 49
LCLDYWYNTQDDNDAILVWGDTNGLIHSIHFNSAKIALFERPSNESNENERQEICLKVNVNEIKDKYKNANYFAYDAHPGWVRKVKWIRSLDCIISCSATDKKSINLGWFEKTNTKTRT